MSGRMIPRGSRLTGPDLIETEAGAGLKFTDGSVLRFDASSEVQELIINLAAVHIVLAKREEAAAAKAVA